MTKGLTSFLFITIALLVGALNYTQHIQQPILLSLNGLKTNYHATIENIEKLIENHFLQSQKILHLESKLKNYENNHLVMRQLTTDLKDLFEENNSGLNTNPKVELVRAISYVMFGNMNKVWLDIEDYNASKIYGLTHNEFVAGIVVPQENKPLALLNKDIKSSYAVYIGSDKAPGIAHGNNSENILVKFIPTWFKVSIGDEIVTSGLDNIFFKGLKVGKVLSVTSSQGYQNAIVKPYFKANELNYFHMIKRVK